MNNKIAFIVFIGLIQFFSINSLGQNDIDIPSEYVSDTSLISMILKTTTAVKTLYVSPKGSGSSCSDSSPCSLSTGIDSLKKGYHLYLKAGTYSVGSGISIDASGSSSSYIVISSAPNEKAILTSTKTDSVSLFEIAGSYIIIQNLTFKNVQAKNVQGIVFYGGGQNHIIIRNNVFDSLKTPKVSSDYGANGVLLMGESEKKIKQVVIYGNRLVNNVLGYSEAISVAGNCEEIYVLDNFLSKNTNIGIDFYGNAGYCSVKKLDQPRKSVAMYNNVEKSNSPYDDCAGIYVDGARDIYVAENTITDSQYGIEIGAEERKDDYPVKNIIVKNNILKGNSITGIRLGGFDEEETGFVQDCEIVNNKISGSHVAVIISKAKNIKFEGNKMTGMDKYFFNMEFSSSYTKNIEIENNVFSGTGRFVLYSSTKLSLDEFIKKYPSNKKE